MQGSDEHRKTAQVLKKILGAHLYSKVDIMLEYKNTKKGWFLKERHVPRGPYLGCQKQQKSRQDGSRNQMTRLISRS